MSLNFEDLLDDNACKMSQGDVYSSEGYTSSDDHSSINSVIHVEIVPAHGSESDSVAEVLSGAERDDGSPAPAVPERPPMYSLPPLPPQHSSTTEEETTSDSEDDSLIRRGGDADSSSTSSEETQV